MIEKNLPEIEPGGPIRSDEAEMSTLGAMLLSERAATELVGKLKAEDFLRPAHQHIFRAMRSLVEGHKPIDMVTLEEEMKALGTLKAAGGAEYLLEIDLFVPSAANSESYAGIVLDRWARRALIAAVGAVEAAARENRTLAEIEQMLQGLPSVIHRARKPKPEPTWSQRVRAQDEERHLGGVSTGNGVLDSIMEYDGFTNGQITLVMAQSGGGKTTWMIGTIFAALDRGLRCAILTFADNTYDDIIRRALRYKCGIPDRKSANAQVQRLRADGYMKEAESLMARFLQAQEEVDAWDLEVYDVAEDDEGGDYETARAWLIRKVDEGLARTIRSAEGFTVPAPKPMSLAGWDYAQEINVGDPSRLRLPFYQQQAWVARNMARLCRNLNVPFIVPVQYTKASDGKEEVADCKVWEKVCELWLRVRDHGLEVRKRRRGGPTEIVPGHTHDDYRWCFVPTRPSDQEALL